MPMQSLPLLLAALAAIGPAVEAFAAEAQTMVRDADANQDSRAEDHAQRIAALEAAVAQLVAGAPPPAVDDGTTFIAAPPIPAPSWGQWLRIPEGVPPLDGEAQDAAGRSLRLPAGEGYSWALVPV